MICDWFRGPLLSVVLPLDGLASDRINGLMTSLAAQVYARWEVVIVVDSASSKDLCGWIDREERCRIVPCSASNCRAEQINSALDVAQGELVVFLDARGMLREDALLLMAVELAIHPAMRFVYSDACVNDENGAFGTCHFRPDWNPELLLGRDYIGAFFAVRADAIRAVGGCRRGFDGAELYDLLLRLSASSEKANICHLPYVLYREPVIADNGEAADMHEQEHMSGRRAVADLLHASCPGAEVHDGPVPMTYRIELPTPDPIPHVSIIIPTRDALDVLRPCVESVLQKTTYSSFDVIVVDNQSTEPAVLDYLRELEEHPRCRIVCYDGPFNFSAINNFAVTRACGELVCLLNNDTEIITPNWLQEMVMWASRDGIGAVGAKLLYSDGTIQHAGVTLGILGVAGHGHKGFSGTSRGYESLLNVVHEVGAVTAACLLVKKRHYQAVGGLDETQLEVAFNDVDFCLKLRASGLRNLWVPDAVLYHHESRTRGSEDTTEKRARFEREVMYMKETWGDALYDDPAYNPNLTLDRDDYSPSCAPRTPLPSARIAALLRNEDGPENTVRGHR